MRITSTIIYILSCSTTQAPNTKKKKSALGRTSRRSRALSSIHETSSELTGRFREFRVTITLPLLLLSLPIATLAAPQGTTGREVDSGHDPLLKYNISAAVMESVDATNNGVAGKQNTFNITVSGVAPGDQPIECSGSWFYDTTKDQTNGRNQAGSSDFVCSDPKLKVTSDQFYQVGTNVEFFVLITYTGFDLAKWYTNTGYDFAWKCEAGGTICWLKDGFVQDSISTPPPGSPAAESADGKDSGESGVISRPGGGRGRAPTKQSK
ncbi:MAG: hypothetical protein L6R36_003978 [Xanthoria steineri]|nr:MAG: hypothetical protein L6R36_003978 [Xanthoria steineri]